MADSLRGQFLIAGKSLRDPNFFRSVVLMLEHEAGGAIGIVVNRPASAKVSTALGGQVELAEEVDRLYVGGPVHSTALFVLHNCHSLDGDSRQVLPGLFVSTTAAVLEAVVQRAAAEDATLKFRIVAGCAGWGAGQLEGEIGRADWHRQPATAELVFDPDVHELWSQLLRRSYQESSILPNLVGDPTLN